MGCRDPGDFWIHIRTGDLRGAKDGEGSGRRHSGGTSGRSFPGCPLGPGAAGLSSPSVAARPPAHAPHTCHVVTLMRHLPRGHPDETPCLREAPGRARLPQRRITANPVTLARRPRSPQPRGHPGGWCARAASARVTRRPVGIRLGTRAVQRPAEGMGARRSLYGRCCDLPCPVPCPAWGLSRVRPPQARPMSVSSQVSVTRAAPPAVS